MAKLWATRSGWRAGKHNSCISQLGFKSPNALLIWEVFESEVCLILCRTSPKTLLTFCTNGVLLRTLMGGDAALATVTHIIVVSTVIIRVLY